MVKGTRRSTAGIAVLVVAASVGCNASPPHWVVEPPELRIPEDGFATGRVELVPSGEPVEYVVVEPPLHGKLELDPATGTFTYRPEPDFNGPDGATVGYRAVGDRVFQVPEGPELPPLAVDFSVMPANDPPVAGDLALQVNEDEVLSGRLVATDVDSPMLTYAIVSPPAHGSAVHDPATGAFTYWPTKDYNGPDSFTYVADDGQATSAPATVAVEVLPVNDPPELPPLPDTTNSAETLETFIALPARDVDGEVIHYAVSVSDPAVADALVDPTGTLILTPLSRGATMVSLSATDGISPATGAFRFNVTDVVKMRRWDIADPQAQAIRIANASPSAVVFELRHNGKPIATSGEKMLQDVRDLVDERSEEAFERKLWRYLRDNVYHYWPLTEAVWIHDPLLLVNSIGFGFCDDVASAYVSLARQAGYPSRAWGLWGHVVPEIQVGGHWSLYDPDLSVYYEDGLGRVVGAAELFGDGTLVTTPRAPLTPDYGTWTGYSPFVADLYTTTDNNYPWWEATFVPARATEDLVLPSGATVTYPGRWTEPPAVYGGGPPPDVFAELRLDLPAGYAGTVDWPLVPWAVEGDGRVTLDGLEYSAGSPELTAALRQRSAPAGGIGISASGPVAIVYLLNPMRFSMSSPSQELSLRSLDAWALAVDLVSLADAARVLYRYPEAVAKPR